MEDIIEEYRSYLKSLKLYRKQTITSHISGAKRFVKYLEVNNIKLCDVSDKVLTEFYSLNKTNRSISNHFMKYLRLSGYITSRQENDVKLIDLWRRYEKYLERRGLSKRSIEATGYIMKGFFSYITGKKIENIHNVDRKIMDEYSASLLLHKTKSGKPYAVTSRYRIITKLKSFFEFLRKEKVILYNPASYIELPKLPQKIIRDVPKLEEIDRLISVIDRTTITGKRDIAMIELMYGTGMRVAELLNLKLKDIDFENGYITIREGKGKRDRVVPVNNIALDVTKDYIHTTGKTNAEAYIFSKDDGSKIDIPVVRLMIKHYTKLAKIRKHFVPHSFRYACATHMLQNGADIRYVQEMLGHKRLSTTQRYTKVVKENLKRMLKRFHPAEINYGGGL